jgi:hypothetical protein
MESEGVDEPLEREAQIGSVSDHHAMAELSCHILGVAVLSQNLNPDILV